MEHDFFKVEEISSNYGTTKAQSSLVNITDIVGLTKIDLLPKAVALYLDSFEENDHIGIYDYWTY
mgnify:CR=1 FL=1